MQGFIKSAKAGDVSSWNVLYQHSYPWLYAKALNIFGNSQNAKDAVQDTFIQAYLNLHQLKDPSSFPAWLNTILMRSCYAISNSHRFGMIEKENDWEDCINSKFEFVSLQGKIYNALSRLPEILQKVVLLRYFSSWNTYEQIAALLAIPIGTVRSRLNYARQKLKEHWQDHSDHPSILQQTNEWNQFYSHCFSTVHFSLNSREKLLQHFDQHLQLQFTSGGTAVGRKWIERLIEEDLVHGSNFANVEVFGSGPITLVEVYNTNSEEYPDRCPDSGIFLLSRSQNKVHRITIHNSK